MTDQLDCNSAIQRSFWDVECGKSTKEVDKDFLVLRKKAIKGWKKELSQLSSDISVFSLKKLSNYLSHTAQKIVDWEYAPVEIKEIYDELCSLYFKKEADDFRNNYNSTGKAIIHILSTEIDRRRQVNDLKIRGQEILKLLDIKLLSDFDKVSEKSEKRFIIKITSFKLSPAADNIYHELKKHGEKNMAMKFKADYEAMLALQVIKLKLKKG